MEALRALCAARHFSSAAFSRHCTHRDPLDPPPRAALLLLLLVAGSLSSAVGTFLCCTPDQVKNIGCGSLGIGPANNASDCSAINDLVTAFHVSLTFGASRIGDRRTGSKPPVATAPQGGNGELTMNELTCASCCLQPRRAPPSTFVTHQNRVFGSATRTPGESPL